MRYLKFIKCIQCVLGKASIVNTCSSEKEKVTNAFEVKLTSTAILSPRPLNFNGKTSEIMSQPIGPNETCRNMI